VATLKPKWVNKPGLIRIHELPVGKFGSVNGHIVYRITPHVKDNQTWLPGLLFVEHHNHLTLCDAYKTDETVSGNWVFMVEQIDFPEKKHCDNAIAMIRKLGKEGKIDGLSYLDHLCTLKSYIKDYLKRKEYDKNTRG
jgi:hypothetical protein